jgi:hypothetical protein
MTLSNGQALVGAHIPTLVPLRETAKLPPTASTLRAIRRSCPARILSYAV